MSARHYFRLLALFGGVSIAGLLFIFLRYADSVSFLQLTFLSLLLSTTISGLIFAVYVIGSPAVSVKQVARERGFWTLVAIWGGLVYAGETLALTWATHSLGADPTVVFYRFWPLMYVLLAIWVLRRPASVLGLSLLAVGTVGLAATLVLLDGGSAFGILPLVPVVVVLAAAGFDAVGTAFVKRLVYPQEVTLFLFNGVALLIVLPIAVWYGAATFSGLSTAGWVAVVWLAFAQNIALTFLFVYGARANTPVTLGIGYLAVPVITMLAAALALHEAPDVLAIVLGMGVVALLVVSERWGSPNPLEGDYVLHLKPEPVPGWRFPTWDVTSEVDLLPLRTPFRRPLKTPTHALYRATQGEGRILCMGIWSTVRLKAPIHAPPLVRGDVLVCFDLSENSRVWLSDEDRSRIQKRVKGLSQDGNKRGMYLCATLVAAGRPSLSERWLSETSRTMVLSV